MEIWPGWIIEEGQGSRHAIRSAEIKGPEVVAEEYEPATVHEKENADQHWSIGIFGVAGAAYSRQLQPLKNRSNCPFERNSSF